MSDISKESTLARVIRRLFNLPRDREMSFHQIEINIPEKQLWREFSSGIYHDLYTISGTDNCDLMYYIGSLEGIIPEESNVIFTMEVDTDDEDIILSIYGRNVIFRTLIEDDDDNIIFITSYIDRRITRHIRDVLKYTRLTLLKSLDKHVLFPNTHKPHSDD